MKKSILINAGMLILLAVVLNSCSTSYEARRYSNLSYVKAGNPKIAQPPVADLKKQEIKSLNNKAVALERSDYTASEKIVEPKQFSRKSLVTNEQSKVINELPGFKSISKADIKKVVKAVVKEKGLQSSDMQRALMDEPGKLLMLWLILLGGAIIFYIIGAATLGGGFYLIGGLLNLAAGVFFILWIVSLVNS